MTQHLDKMSLFANTQKESSYYLNAVQKENNLNKTILNLVWTIYGMSDNVAA
jgi:hypothetical protein